MTKNTKIIAGTVLLFLAIIVPYLTNSTIGIAVSVILGIIAGALLSNSFH